MSSIAFDSCDYHMGDYFLMMRDMGVRIMVILRNMMISIIKSQMRMIATVPKDKMIELLNTTFMVKIDSKKTLVVSPMMMREHVRDLNHSESEVCSNGDTRTFYTSQSQVEGRVRYNTVI